MRSETIANAILEDRRNRKPTASRSRAPADDFDPFGFTRWRVVAGADPAYVVKTPMRRAPVGWFIDCQHCGGEFESLGLPYCTRCLEKPAEERRANRKPAERSTVAGATEHRGTSRKSPTVFSQKSDTEIIEEFPRIFGPADFPSYLVGPANCRGRLLAADVVEAILCTEASGHLLADTRRRKAMSVS
jgi:hypothetical protein